MVCVKVNIYFGIFMAKYSMDAGGGFLHFIFMAIKMPCGRADFPFIGVMKGDAVADTNRKCEW